MWLDDDKSQQRAREGQFYNTDTGEKVGKKPKSKAKPNPRADHKHEYVPVVIWCKRFGGFAGAWANVAKIAAKRNKAIPFFARRNHINITEKWNIFGKKTTNSPR